MKKWSRYEDGEKDQVHLPHRYIKPTPILFTSSGVHVELYHAIAMEDEEA